MADFYAIITDTGEAKIANALALGQTVDITKLAVGDGEGNGAQGTPLPDPGQTTLVSEQRRASINQLSVDDQNANVLIAEQVIPEDVGGWWIREMGLFDVDGDLIAVCNTPPTYKPVLASGSGRTQVVRMQMIVSDTGGVTLKIDPSIVLATRQYADDAVQSHAQSRNHPPATTTAQGMIEVATQSEVDAGTDTTRAIVPSRLAQSQHVLGRTNNGDPNGALAAARVYERCWDTSKVPAVLYIATAADGTTGGSTWTPLTDFLRAATTTQKGIVELASESEAKAGTDATRPVASSQMRAAVNSFWRLREQTGGDESDLSTSFEERLSVTFTPEGSNIFVNVTWFVQHTDANNVNDFYIEFQLIDLSDGTLVASGVNQETATANDFEASISNSVSLGYNLLTRDGRQYKLSLKARKTKSNGPSYPRQMRIMGFEFG